SPATRTPGSWHRSGRASRPPAAHRSPPPSGATSPGRRATRPAPWARTRSRAPRRDSSQPVLPGRRTPARPALPVPSFLLVGLEAVERQRPGMLVPVAPAPRGLLALLGSRVGWRSQPLELPAEQLQAEPRGLDDAGVVVEQGRGQLGDDVEIADPRECPGG